MTVFCIKIRMDAPLDLKILTHKKYFSFGPGPWSGSKSKIGLLRKTFLSDSMEKKGFFLESKLLLVSGG